MTIPFDIASSEIRSKNFDTRLHFFGFLSCIYVTAKFLKFEQIWAAYNFEKYHYLVGSIYWYDDFTDMEEIENVFISAKECGNKRDFMNLPIEMILI